MCLMGRSTKISATSPRNVPPLTRTATPVTNIYTLPATSVNGYENMTVLFLDVRLDAGL